ncbi:MAG: DUF2029 domain-containing protein [Opitutae bacterium]|nr:DUF2029 domain-containing protein [Opitutae bacterium]
MSAQARTLIKPAVRLWLERLFLFLLVASCIFTFPLKPSYDLDASWRMALGKFFLDGRQFGRDIVFTYGPLGFLMGKTYSGLMFWSLLAWQVTATGFFATLILYWGERLAGWARLGYFAFLVLFGVTYEDALHMLMIALAALELLRRVERPWHWSSALLLLMMATQSVAKFTNLMLAAVAVVTITAFALWRHHRRSAVRLLAWYGGGYLLIWILCGQNPLNLPAYLRNSWHVSQGYQEAMGIITPDQPFWKALVVIAVLAGYILLNVLTQPDRPRSLAGAVILGAFLHLNWKHGFVRSDGHMVGFFYCALLPITAFPVLLDETGPFLRIKRWALVGAGVLCVFGIRDAIPALVDSAHYIFRNRVLTNLQRATHLADTHAEYDQVLARELALYDLPHTRVVVGRRSLDVFGYDQASAIYNRFNYTPRPVFQSYSAYTPELAKLNADFYRSDRAPDFVLLKVGSIDGRLPAMDDSAVLYLFTQRYKFILNEKFFQLWQKTGVPVDPAETPRLLERRNLPVGQPWSLAEHNQLPLWVQIDLRPSLLGRLRTFFYKPPLLQLAIEDTQGLTRTYRMPAPIGRAGFIINPIIEDLTAFTRYAINKPERTTRQITLMLAPADRKYFAPTAQVGLSRLNTSTAAQEFFNPLNRERFYMFGVAPVSFESANLPTNEQIDGREVMVIHAPSEMVFDVPRGATTLTGQHGFLAGAYEGSNNTNGADFVIAWSDGKESVEIYRRFLNPKHVAADRGLINFKVDLSPYIGGRLYLRTLPGPYNDMGWDWTAWSKIDIK